MLEQIALMSNLAVSELVRTSAEITFILKGNGGRIDIFTDKDIYEGMLPIGNARFARFITRVGNPLVSLKIIHVNIDDISRIDTVPISPSIDPQEE